MTPCSRMVRTLRILLSRHVLSATPTVFRMYEPVLLVLFRSLYTAASIFCEPAGLRLLVTGGILPRSGAVL